MTAAFELNLSALSLLALVVGMFLIYNTVTFSVVQRRPIFGVLRCIGVTGGQLFRLILTESAVLSLLGAVLGVGLGILLGRGMVRLITQTINDFYFVVNVQSVDVPPWTLLKGILIGVAAAVLIFHRSRPGSGAYDRRKAHCSVLPWKAVYSASCPGCGWHGPFLTALGIFLLWIHAGLVIIFAGLFAVLIAAASFDSAAYRLSDARSCARWAIAYSAFLAVWRRVISCVR